MGAAGNSLKSNKTHFTELKEITMTSLMVSMTAYIAGVKDRFTREEKGATMVEYGLMVALIAIIVAVGAAALGTGIDKLFDDTTLKL
jgi:pilus assembly protein Flp/PilA